MSDTTFLYLAPQPKEFSYRQGTFFTRDKRYIKLEAQDPELLIPAAKRIGRDWEIIVSDRGRKDDLAVLIRLDEHSDIRDEGYELTVTPTAITIIASSHAGAFYGACTLTQILRQCQDDIPCLSIMDWPDFPSRGVMIDVSRDKVPTMETLYHIVELLAGWKINQLQLYTEHTFAYARHPVVWENASPITGEEILALDTYCKSRFIDLVPSQNSFGHMERWLKHDEYRPMAECPDGFEAPWGYSKVPCTLCPVDPRAVELIESLYAELLPYFSSRLFNVGCDETWELGKGRSAELCERKGVGRVYLDFLLDIQRMAKDHSRTIMFWGDVVKKHPEMICDIPKDAIALEWGYECDHPWAEHSARFKEGGIPFYVCPGVSSTASFAGRTENVIDNITSAAKDGLGHGAIGLLNTCWQDMGGWQPLSASYLGLMVGAMASWNAAGNVRNRLINNLSIHAFGDSTGKIAKAFYDLGNTYLIFKNRYMNQSLPWHLVLLPNQQEFYKDAQLGEYEELEERLKEVSAAIRGDAMTVPDAEFIRRELKHMTNVLELAACAGKLKLGRGSVEELEVKTAIVKDYHKRVWLLRNRPGGLSDSLDKISVEAIVKGQRASECAAVATSSMQYRREF